MQKLIDYLISYNALFIPELIQKRPSLYFQALGKSAMSVYVSQHVYVTERWFGLWLRNRSSFPTQGIVFDSNNPADCSRVFFICEYPPVQVVQNKTSLVFLASYPVQTNPVCLFFHAQGKADVLCALVFIVLSFK